MSSTVCLCSPEALERVATRPDLRIEKVRRVRRQLAEGRYPVSKGLDIAADRLLEELLR